MPEAALDPVAVRVGDLDAGEAVIVLPLGLRDAGLAQPHAGAADIVGVLELKAEVDRPG